MDADPWPVVDELREHARWRPDWTNDRPRLLWYITFRDHPQLAERCQEAEAGLRHLAAVNAVPPRWLHLTLDDVGFVDEVPEDKLDDLVESLPEVLEGWRLPSLTLGPLAAMEDALVLRTEPYAELRELRDRLRAVTAATVGGPVVDGPEEFLPHVSLAYVREACEPPVVMGPLEDRSSETVVIESAELTLAEVTRHDQHYEWKVRAVMPLEDAPT